MTRTCKCRLLALLVLAGLWGVPCRAAKAILIDGVAAHVNGHVITISEVLSAMAPLRRKLIQTFSGVDLKQKLNAAYRDAVNAAIDRQLVIDLYEEGEARLPEWLVDQRAETFIRETFDGDRAALLKALSEEMITYDEWKRRMEEQLIIASMRGSSVESHAVVSPEDIRRYYDEHREEFTSGSGIHLGMIMLLKGNDVETAASRVAAESASKRIMNGELFADVAREVSAGTKADAGGDWGWISAEKLRPELSAPLALLEAGVVSDIIETDGEFYILRVHDKRKAVQTTFSEAQPGIERKLKREITESLYGDWVGRLRRNAYIKLADLELF